MTLAKGDVLVKVVQKSHSGTTLADRIRGWAANHQETLTSDYVIPDAELAAMLTGYESYAVHEVMTDVHYESRPPTDEKPGYSLAPAVDLKVIY
jgi:hypothetical protein